MKLANDMKMLGSLHLSYTGWKIGSWLHGKNESLEKFDLGFVFFFFHFLHSPWFFIALV